MSIRSSTWNKESNELLDYETQDVTKFNCETRVEGGLYKNNHSIKFISNYEKNLEENKNLLIAKIECTDSKFFLKRSEENLNKLPLSTQVNKNDSPWFVIKYLKDKDSDDGYKIMQGDVIKLGRIKFKISEIKINNILDDSVENHTKHFATKLNEKSNGENEAKENILKNSLGLGPIIYNKDDNYYIDTKSFKKNKNLCRICYCDEKEVDSPLIQPCLCSGTMKFIHFCCLQKWIKSKVSIKTTTSENCISYSLKQIECELCKSLLPGNL